MLRLLTIAVVVLSTLVSTAADLKIGDSVFLKSEAEVTKDGTKVEIKTIRFPATVAEIEGETVFLLGQVSVRINDVMTADKAVEFYTESIKLDPKNAKAYVSRGSVLSARARMRISFVNSESDAKRYATDLENAIHDFNEAVKLDPTNATVIAARGSILMRAKKLEAAIEDMTEAIRLSSSNNSNFLASAYIGRASVWESKGEYDKAIEDSIEAIKADPKFVPALGLIAQLKSTCPDDRVRDGKQAIEYATKACELIGAEYEMDRWSYLDTLAAAYAEAGDFMNAIQWEEKALENLQESEYSAFTRVRATSLCSEHLDLYRANKPCRGPQKSPDPASQKMQADAKQKIVQSVEARWAKDLKQLDESIKLNPTNAMAYFNRGSYWARRAFVAPPYARGTAVVRGNTATFCENALSDLSEAIRLDRTVADAFETRGRVSAKTGKVDAAIADLSEATKLDPHVATAYCSRGDCWKEKGEFDKALKDWTEGLQYESENKKAFFERIAWLRATCPDERFRNGKEAVKYALKASKSDGLFDSVLASALGSNWGEWELYGTLAAAYAEEGDFKKAIKWQKKALEAAGQFMDDKTDDGYVPPGYKERLELYRDNKPFRDIPKR